MAELQAEAPYAAVEDSIRQLVDLFYARVRQDPQLGPVFAGALGESEAAWAQHLARLSDFWSSVVLRSGRYHGDPFSTHLRLPDLEPAMFDRWLALWGETCTEVLDPELADIFRDRADRIARSLRMGLFERLPAKLSKVSPP
jgi:hemoglobin